MKMKVLWIAGLMLAATTGQVQAAVLFSSTAVVTTVDRSATFNSLTSNGINLSSYSEGLLSVTVNDTTFQGFSAFAPGDGRTTGFHYGNGGNNDFVTIKATDSAVFSAIDFLLGDGRLPITTTVRWQSYLNGILTGSGTQSNLGKGIVVGWTDANGIDELRVAALSTTLPGFGNAQGIVIDDLRAQFSSTPVPEPSSIAMFGVGALGLIFARRKRQQTTLTA